MTSALTPSSAVNPREAGAFASGFGSDLTLGLLALGIAALGAVIILAALGTGDYFLLAVGAGAVGLALITLIVLGLTDGFIPLILASPAPALYRTEDLRLAAVLPVTLAVLLAWAVRIGFDRTVLDWGRFPRRATLAWIATAGLAAVASPYLELSVREWFNLTSVIGLMAVATLAFRANPRRRWPVIETLVAVAALTGAFALLESRAIISGEFPRYGTSYFRAALGFGQPNALAEFLGIIFPLAVVLANRPAGVLERAARWGLAALIGAGLLVTFSRGSVLSLLIGLAGTGLAGGARWTLRTLLLVLGFLLGFDLVTGGLLGDTITRTVGDVIVEQRVGLVWSGVLMFLDRPFLGFGPGGYAEALSDYGAQVPGLYDYLPTPHNAFVQMAAETGIVGLLAFVAFLGAGLGAVLGAARAAARDRDGPSDEHSLRRGLVWSYLAFCGFCLVEWPFSHGTGEAVALIVALGFAAPAARARAGSRST